MSKDAAKIRQQIAAWRHDLISMSRRNKLLYFSHTKSSSLEIVEPSSFVVLDLLESRKHRLELYEPEEPSLLDELSEGPAVPQQGPRAGEVVAHVREGNGLAPATSARLRTVLRSLRRAATQDYLDKGIQSLYLAFGVLKWFDSRDEKQPCYAPLFLVPVELRSEEARSLERLFRQPEEDAVVNPALAIKLESDFGLELPAGDDYEVLDVPQILSDVRDLVSDMPGWEVQDRVILGRFAFHKDVMYRDLLENEDALASHEFVQALVDGLDSKPDYSFDVPPEDELDRRVQPEDMFNILDADSSQRQCIWAAAEGKSFVMDGPPGTGKSQTIANMISELIANDRTVLFVSEKAAALEVVHRRLESKGLHEYVLQLHSHKATRREVAHELGRSLERRPSLDERMPEARIKTLKRRRKELTEYATAMNEVRQPLARSLHWVIGRLVQLSDMPASDAAVEVTGSLSAADLEAIRTSAAQLGRAWGPVKRGDGFLWRDLETTYSTAAERKSLEDGLKAADERLLEVRAVASRDMNALGLPAPESVAQSREAAALLALLAERRGVPAAWLTLESIDEITARLEDIEQHQRDRAAAEAGMRERLGDLVEPEPLDGLSARFAAAVEGLASAACPFRPDPALSMEQLEGLNEEWKSAVEQVGPDVARDVEALCLRLGVAADTPSIGLVTDLLELLAMAEDPDRPESRWLESGQLAALKESRTVLAAIVDSYRDSHERVTAVFNDQILELPAEDLALRFKNVHKGLSSLLPACRRDRKLLKPACRLGKVTPDAIAMLDEAAALQQLVVRLGDAEHARAGSLGSYYAGTDTDFERVDRALEAAAAALSLVSHHIDLAAALPYVAVDGQIDPETRLRVHSIQGRLEVFRAFAEAHLGVVPQRWNELSLAEALEALEAGPGLLDEILAVRDAAQDAGGSAASVGDLEEGLVRAQEAIDAARLIDAEAEAHRGALAHYYSGPGTDVARARDDLAWSQALMRSANGPLELETAKKMLDADVPTEALDLAISAWDEAAERCLRVFEPTRSALIRDSLEGDFTDANDVIVGLLRSMDDIQEWDAFAAALADLSEAGLAQVGRFCIQERVSAERLVGVIERRVLETWADACLEADRKRLGSLRATDRDSLVSEFRELDEDLVRLRAGAIMEACNSNRPSTGLGAAAIIQREAQKRKRHMPIRRLLAQTREVTLAVKPCFMMSPLSVSQFLEPDFRFDVVIFDEASQIRPHDAANCIYRGRQHVIAGDRHQLPPTSFFDRHADDGDEWQEDQLEQYESVLEKAKASQVVPSISLLWHYRSRHEDLITFSNYSFYEGGLVTFPSPMNAAPPLGVGFVHVDGVYRRGGAADNLIEAREVANLVGYYLREHPGLSIGVVAFSQAQELAIENAVDELRASDPSLPSAAFSADRLDGFFVKNLESVQGDERDVIILSVGYGPDENGKLTMNFGPVNVSGGYRRLNVAVTRARRRMELVSSIRASDISSGNENEGVRHLRRYLDYAENGPSTLAFDGPESGGGFESPLEAEVARTMRGWGYDVVPQVGCAGYRVDLGVRSPDGAGGFALGIECDGAAYHSSKTARDRDRLRESVLRNLGWRLHRIWGPAWYRQRASEESRLREVIESAMSECERPREDVVYSPAQREPMVLVEDVVLATEPEDFDWVCDYEVGRPSIGGWELRTPLGDPSVQPLLRRAISEIVEVEGPIHESLLLERVRVAWGSGRAGSRIQENFDFALDHLQRRDRKIGRDAEGFVRYYEMPTATSRGFVRSPVAGDPRTMRSAQQVAQEELVLAAKKLLEAAPGITRDDLSIQVAAIFGWGRRGHEIASAIDQAIDAVGFE